MGWLDEQMARDAARQGVASASAGSTGYVSGLLHSAASSIPELFGQSPTPEAQQFRMDNPVMGVVSEIIPTLVPYAGMFKLSQTAKGAALLDGAMAKTGINCV